MKTLLLCLILLASPAWAQSGYVQQLNARVNAAVQAKDWDKARDLAVTQEQKEFVRKSTEYDRQAKPSKKHPKATSCYTAGNRVMCY